MKKRLLLAVVFVTLFCAALFAACGGDGAEAVKYRLTVTTPMGGQITMTAPSSNGGAATQAAAGETVTVICTPDEGCVFKEGSLKVNEVPIEGYTFVMPECDVNVSGEFVSEHYQGAFIYYRPERSNYIFEFIQVGESTLTVGVTIATYADNFDYVIYENIPYEVNAYTITATVAGEAWRAEIGNGTLFHEQEYVLSQDVAPLSGTYTEISEQNNGFIERDYTFSDGTLTCTRYFENGEKLTEESTYKQYGNFLFIEEPDDLNETNKIRYGVLNTDEYGIGFLYNYHAINAAGEPYASSDFKNLYPKQEQEVALKTDGAYLLKEHFNPLNGESWGEAQCYDFIAVKGEELAFSRHGVNYNGDLHYFGANTAYVRFGNVLKVTYSFDELEFELVFHILNENTVYIKDAANSLQKFVFTENCAFTGGYGEKFTNADSPTYEAAYYEEGRFGEKVFEKLSDNLMETREYGTYELYGNLLVTVQNGGEMRIGTVTEQNPATDECDYVFHYRTVAWNGMCEDNDTDELLWKELV